MAEDCKQRGQRFDVARRNHGQQGSGDGGSEEHGGGALDDIEDERGGAQAFAFGAQHIGCADVAAAESADILAAKEAHQHISHGDRPEQVGCERDPDEWEEHNGLSLTGGPRDQVPLL